MKRKAANLLSVASLALAVAAIIAARQWSPAAAVFPIIIALLVGSLAALNLWIINFAVNWGGREEVPLDLHLSPPADQPGEVRNVAAIFLWLIGFLLAVFLIGFPPAALLFVFLYLRMEGREGWVVSLIATGLTGLFLYLLFIVILKVSYRQGWLLTVIPG